MSPFASPVRRSALLCCALVSLSCNDNPTEPEVRVPAALDIVSGDAQEGVVGAELANPIVVRVEDVNGDASPAVVGRGMLGRADVACNF